MKLTIIAAAVLSVALPFAALANVSPEQMKSFEADCHKYAQEDGVEADQLDSYVAQCAQDLALAQSEAADDEPAESEEDKD